MKAAVIFADGRTEDMPRELRIRLNNWLQNNPGIEILSAQQTQSAHETWDKCMWLAVAYTILYATPEEVAARKTTRTKRK